jgi:hypothetical protein
MEKLHTENDMRPEIFHLHRTKTEEKPAMATLPRKQRPASACWIAACVAAILFVAGCSRMEDTNVNFTKAIDQYYSTHPSCLWQDSTKFPLEDDASNPRETRGYEALVSQSLLVQMAGQEKVLIAESKAGNSYDLTDKGHSAWTSDPQKPGFGNLCYGHRTVTSIDSTSPTTSQSGATTTVVYRYVLSDVPAWAKSTETQTAFSSLQADLSGNQVGRVTLTDTHKGWLVSDAPWAHIYDSDIYK